MATVRRPKEPKMEVPSSVWLFLLVFVAAVFFILLPAAPDTKAGTGTSTSGGERHPAGVKQKIQSALAFRRQELHKALHSLTDGNIPYRLRTLRDNHEIIGERLAEVSSGKETVEELLHGIKAESTSNKPPMDVEEVIKYLDNWIHQLHETLSHHKDANFDGIWEAYHDLTVKTLYPWDREYLSRMPTRRDDGSIFLSIASYRDENCFNTLRWAYEKAEHPEKLFVGLVQQNCHANCKSGVLTNLSMVTVEPDADCYEQFCQTQIGKEVCRKKQVRVLNIDEPESLGPYAARFFASKLWSGKFTASMNFMPNSRKIASQVL